MFQNNIDAKGFTNSLLVKTLYSSKVTSNNNSVVIEIDKAGENDEKN